MPVIIRRMLMTGLGIAVLLTGLSSKAWAIPLGVVGAGTGESRGIASFIGKTVCVQCTLHDVKVAQPE